MKVNVDFSIFSSANHAYGNVSGVLDLPEYPGMGDSISFAFSNLSAMPEANFPGFLTVESKRYDVRQEVGCSIGLSDVVVNGQDEAERLMSYFENGFGLCGYRYES